MPTAPRYRVFDRKVEVLSNGHCVVSHRAPREPRDADWRERVLAVLEEMGADSMSASALAIYADLSYARARYYLVTLKRERKIR